MADRLKLTGNENLTDLDELALDHTDHKSRRMIIQAKTRWMLDNAKPDLQGRNPSDTGYQGPEHS